jgi:2-hydroxychromene-2-carboxylate isomerase
MQLIRCYLDPISPYAALGFWRLPAVLQGRSYAVEYRPILLAGLLKAHESKGPAEIEPKRAWTYRHVSWLAHTQGLPLQMPAQHPFNPLPLLRLAWACAPANGTPSRWVVEQILAHVWRSDGASVDDPARFALLAERLEAQRGSDEETAKTRLRQAGDAALAAGAFGVPTFELNGRLFWGQDALPMLASALDGDPWFDDGTWERAAQRPLGVERR